MTIARAASGLAVGALFGVGLAISQMTNPQKVLSFLNVIGRWDASLLFVMGAATVVTFVGFRVVTRRSPLFAAEHALPTATRIDARLIGGAAIFGLGWGLAGYCPGPAISGLASGSMEPLVFVPAMLAGSQVARLLADR